MADESLHTIPLEHNIDYHIVTLFERLEAMRKDGHGGLVSGANNRLSNNMQPKRSMQAEIRTLEFWRSIISECLASFFYVFIVCGAAAGAGVGASVSSVLLATSLASGLAMATLTQCFLHISGAHINPAVTLASCVIRSVSPIRAAMYITAQCGGGIAGAALLYGVTVPGYQGNLQAAISHSASLAAWERFGVEFILTFIVVLTYFVSTDSYKKYIGNSALSIGAAYSACSFVSMPYLNPARSLGPSFVLNKWDNHWVYWFGPLVGGITSGIIYEYIFNSRRSLRFMSKSGAADNDSSSIHSDDDLNYDLDVDKPHKYQQGHGTYQRGKPVVNAHHVPVGGVTMGTMGGGNYCQNLYTAPPPLGKFEQPEPLYGGTRSMYCRSPTLTRSNLNRSQSVYAKSNTAINRDIVPRPGPLVPAQSLYPMRVSQQQAHQAAQSHLQNQNVQNQLQQRSESIYGLRTATRNQQQQQQQQQHHNQQMSHQQQQHQHQHHQQQQQQQQQMPHHSASTDGPPPVFPAAVYGSRQNPNPMDGNLKFERRPESVYGMTTVPRNRGQSAQSDDSSYGSYHGSAVTPPARNTNGEPLMMYVPPPQPVQSQQQQQHQQQQQQQQQQAPPSTQQVMRTQSERKVSAPVVVSSHQTVPPPMSMTYTNSQVNSPTPVTTSANSQQQQQQAQMLQQQTQNQQQPHYGVMSMRPN